MGVFTSSDEYICLIPPARLFKALVLDSHNLIPKIMPQAVKSIEIIHGDGKVAGSIKQINVVQGM
ncbi:Major allergen Mal d 1 [Morus notabilis]|uniref:Major allergen Mal d 1 n=1 Tax=Morus notabilis TaxID=981085 RepID=W9T1U7_9ROSA|nr:Major allergen Mal d 1 [Morus notabilis]